MIRFPPSSSHKLIPGTISQPLCIAIQVALVNLLRTWNVHPDIVIGHSSGELPAAYASGALSLENTITLAYWRGQSLLYASEDSKGAMAAVELGEQEAKRFLGEDGAVVVACVNSPSNVTLSGEAGRVKEVVERVQREKPGVFARVLNVDHAYHSSRFEMLRCRPPASLILVLC